MIILSWNLVTRNMVENQVLRITCVAVIQLKKKSFEAPQITAKKYYFNQLRKSKVCAFGYF